MKGQKITIAILTIICLQTNLFADIAPRWRGSVTRAIYNN